MDEKHKAVQLVLEILILVYRVTIIYEECFMNGSACMRLLYTKASAC